MFLDTSLNSRQEKFTKLESSGSQKISEKVKMSIKPTNQKDSHKNQNRAIYTLKYVCILPNHYYLWNMFPRYSTFTRKLNHW